MNQGYGGLGLVVRGIAAGVGLASESINHHKQKKAARQADEAHRKVSDMQAPPAYEENDSQIAKEPSHASKHQKEPAVYEVEQGDEEHWDLDDAQEDIISQELVALRKRPFEHNPRKITQVFIDDYPLSQGGPSGRLSLPVVLPQRRPKDRTRGFIRAHAPELQNCGIDQPMFLDFLETFNLASLASPWLNAINLGALDLMHLPFLVNQAASLALMLAIQVAKNMQSRHRYDGRPSSCLCCLSWSR